MTEPRGDDPERDAWLRAALAHAPDADAGAPAALSAAILRAAADRHAPTAPGAWQRLLDAWSWLARPPVAAGFASVMVATVVGLMWWGRPIDEAMPRPPAPARAEQPAAPVAATAAADPAPTKRLDEAAAVVAASMPSAAAISRRVASPAPTSDPATPPPPAPRPSIEPMLQEKSEAAPAAEAADRPRARAFGDADQSGERRSVATPIAASAPAPAMAPAAPAAVEATQARLGAATGVAERALPRLKAEAPLDARLSIPPLSPPATLLSGWLPDAADWRWQPPDGPGPLPAAGEARAWLRRVDLATRGRWTAAATGSAGGAAARWWRGDVAMGTLTFEADGLRWLGPDGQAAFAPLDAATLVALRAL